MSISAKIAEIQGTVTFLSKRQVTVQSQKTNTRYNYEYIEEGEMFSDLQPKLREAKIATVPRTIIHTVSGNMAAVQTEWDFIDSEDGSTLTASMPGMATDLGDKAMSKATTVSTRLLLWKVFVTLLGIVLMQRIVVNRMIRAHLSMQR